VKDKKVLRPVVFFKETNKFFVPNKTNLLRMRAIYGGKAGDFEGKTICLTAVKLERPMLGRNREVVATHGIRVIGSSKYDVFEPWLSDRTTTDRAKGIVYVFNKNNSKNKGE
jgi:hypothetical protein